MTDEDAFILTHYTDIAESKQRDVRELQAEAARSVMRDMIASLQRVFQKTDIETQTHS